MSPKVRPSPSLPPCYHLSLTHSTTTSTSCVTETLTNIQVTTGTLSLTEATTLITSIAGGGSLNLPSTTTCTSCTKEAYNIVNKNWPGLIGSDATVVQSTCGAEFVGTLFLPNPTRFDSNLFSWQTVPTHQVSSKLLATLPLPPTAPVAVPVLLVVHKR